jgi:hypothetical protein
MPSACLQSINTFGIGNGTILKTQGSSAIGLQLQDNTFNWIVSYSRKRFKVGLKWNYIPEGISDLTSIGPNGVSVSKSKTTMDLDSEFRCTPCWGCSSTRAIC